MRELAPSKLNTHLSASPVSANRLIRFAAGISWKYSVTKAAYGRIDVGPYTDILEDIAFGEERIPPSVDMMTIRLKALRFEHHFFRAPKLDRKEGVNFVRFTLGGFLMLLKIDSRRSPNFSRPDIWMKDRSDVVFPVLPLSHFEEGRFVKEGWQSDEKLMNFFIRNMQK